MASGGSREVREHQWREATDDETVGASDPHTTRKVCTVCGLNICEPCGINDPGYRPCGKRESWVAHLGGVCGTCGAKLHHSEHVWVDVVPR